MDRSFHVTGAARHNTNKRCYDTLSEGPELIHVLSSFFGSLLKSKIFGSSLIGGTKRSCEKKVLLSGPFIGASARHCIRRHLLKSWTDIPFATKFIRCFFQTNKSLHQDLLNAVKTAWSQTINAAVHGLELFRPTDERFFAGFKFLYGQTSCSEQTFQLNSAMSQRVNLYTWL